MNKKNKINKETEITKTKDDTNQSIYGRKWSWSILPSGVKDFEFILAIKVITINMHVYATHVHFQYIKSLWLRFESKNVKHILKWKWSRVNFGKQVKYACVHSMSNRIVDSKLGLNRSNIKTFQTRPLAKRISYTLCFSLTLCSIDKHN